MSQVIAQAASQSQTSVTLSSVSVEPTDVVLLIHIHRTSSGTPSMPTAVTGCGATWSQAAVVSSGRVALWIGTNPTSTGVITPNVAVSASLFAAVVRGVSPALASAQGMFDTTSMLVEVPNAVEATSDQVVFVGGVHTFLDGTLSPVLADWTKVEVGSVTRGLIDAPPAGPATLYRASTTTSSGVGNMRIMSQFVIGQAPPGDPLALAITAATPSSLSIAWSPPVGGTVPTAYDVRVDAGDPVDVGLATDHTFVGLDPETTYTLEVRARAGGSASAWVTIPGTTPPVPAANGRWWTHRIAAAAGLDPVAAQPVVQVRVWDGTGYVVDDALSRGLQSYQVTYGRKDSTSRVEPLTCALVWATPALTSTPGVATRLQVALSPALCDAIGLDPDDGIRFTGEVTDPAVAYARRLTTAATAGRLGRAHRMPVDGTGWPVESDAARIARILPAARVGLQVGTIDPPAVNVAPPTRLDTVATLLEKTSTSALGQVVEQPSGVIDYHGPDHRRDPAVAVTLTAGQVLRDVTWSQRLASLVNDLDVKLDDGTVVTITDPESADPNRYGPWPASIDTILTSTTDAGALGVDVVGRRADPSWQLPDLTLDLVRTIPLDALPAVLALRHGSLLEVTGLPVGFPLASGRMFVEGYVETATPRTWSLVPQVSDPLQSGVGIRWIDWPDTDDYQWQDLDPDLTWLDLARIYDPADTL